MEGSLMLDLFGEATEALVDGIKACKGDPELIVASTIENYFKTS